MTSFAITLYGQCCLLHVVEQRVVSDISIIGSCSLCFAFEYKNTNMLLRLLIGVLGTSVLLHIPNIACPTTWRRVTQYRRVADGRTDRWTEMM